MRGAVLIRRLTLAAVVVLACAAGSLVVRRLILSKGLSWTTDVATVGAFVLPLAAFFGSIFRRWWRGAPAVSQLTVNEAIARLAPVFLRQWSERNRESQVYDPGAMRVRFEVTQFTQSLMTTVSLGGGPASGKGHGPQDLSGSFETILDIFLKTNRLVITGPAGSGKSVLVTKLACDLARELRTASANSLPEPAGKLLPVVLKASTLKSGESLNRWIANELISIDHELSLRPKDAIDKKTTLAEAIVSGGVIPIIDGVDELPAGLRGEAIRIINEAGSDRPLVVTSRPREYSGAVAAAGREIARGAVVEMLPLSLPAVENYLREAAAPRALPRWQLVFDQLAAEPDGPLAATLTNPLMLWLCRTIYAQDSADPGELADRTHLGSRRAIDNHLLDAFLPAIYRDGAGPWTATQARQWLGFLASFAEQTRATELAWWRFRKAIAGWRIFSALSRGALLGALAWWLVVWILRQAGDWQDGRYTGRTGFEGLLLRGPAWPVVRPGIDRVLPIIGQQQFYQGLHTLFQAAKTVLSYYPWSFSWTAFIAAWVFMIWSLPATFDGEARPVSIKLARDVKRFARFLGVILLSVFACIILIEAVLAMSPAAANERPATRGLFVLALIVIAIFVVPDDIKMAPADVYGSRNPVRVVRRDRVTALASGVARYAAIVSVLWLFCGVIIGVSAFILCAANVLSELTLGNRWASGSFADTRVWLAVTRRMPLRALAFLEDAHRRGALGRTGSVYHFRHLRLQRRLAEGHVTLMYRAARSRLGSLILGSLILHFSGNVPRSTDQMTHPVWARRFAERAAAMTDIIGRCDATGPVYSEPPGMAQRFSTTDDQDWLMCALPGASPILVPDSIWNLLHDIRAETDGADAFRALGFPVLPASAGPDDRVINSGTTRIELAGGALGPSVFERDSGDGEWRWRPLSGVAFTERLIRHRMIGRSRVRVSVRLPRELSEITISPPLFKNLEGKVRKSEFSKVIGLFGASESRYVWLRRTGIATGYHHRWHVAASGDMPALKAAIRASLSTISIRVDVNIVIKKPGAADGRGVPSPDNRRLGLPLQQLLDMILAAWQVAADVIPGAIPSTPRTSTSAPTVTLTLRAPSSPAEVIGMRARGRRRDTRQPAAGQVRSRTVTERKALISGPVAGLPDSERERYTRQALTRMAPGFGYSLPDGWDEG